jgi:YegS/Rv2252/BmrU family lipid kinase
MSSTQHEDGVIILNPVSGDAQHKNAVEDRATLQGHSVKKTHEQGDAITLAQEAAAGGESLIIAAGGDGTVNEVLQGIDRADAFERVTVGVIPVGTGNNFAENIGISTIDEGFTAVERCEVRHVDIGRANDKVFVNSCVGGLTADASAETSHELKHKYGVLAYVITTIRTATTFEGLRLSISTGDEDDAEPAWKGQAFCVFVGNGRRFPTRGRTQANMEDGRFEVTVIEDVPTADLIENALVQWLFDTVPEYTRQLQASHLDITGLDEDPVNFSLDGEMVQSETLSLEVEPNTIRLLVGEDYEPTPDR